MKRPRKVLLYIDFSLKGVIPRFVEVLVLGIETKEEFQEAFDLVKVNSCFPMKEDHLVTFRSMLAKTDRLLTP